MDIYSFAWAEAKDPIINGFICESGAAPITTGDPWKVSSWYALSARLGCGGPAQGNSTVACVKTKSMEEIVEASLSDGGKRPEIDRLFVPVIDEKTYFSDYVGRAAAGRFIQRVRQLLSWYTAVVWLLT